MIVLVVAAVVIVIVAVVVVVVVRNDICKFYLRIFIGLKFYIAN